MTTPSSVQASTPAPVPVRLGDHDYMVVPQRKARLLKRLGPLFGDLGDIDFDSAGGLLDMVGDRVHAVLQVFIPDLMPDYEFHGYPTREAYEQSLEAARPESDVEDPYDEEYDKSPDPAQIVAAFEAVTKANRFDLFKHLGKLLGPDLVRATIARAVDRAMPMLDSPSLPAESGESRSTSSTTTPPTSGGGESPEPTDPVANGSRLMATGSPSPG